MRAGTVEQWAAVAVDAELSVGLAHTTERIRRPGESVIDAERRRRVEFERSVAKLHPEVTIEERQVEGITIRTYRAERSDAELLWVHGGGWAYGDAATDEGMCARFALEAGVSVTTLAYRLAPEHPFPAAMEDVETVYRWIRSRSMAPLLVGGASAGGALTAGLSLLLREASEPQPALQLLICPALDAEGSDVDAGPLSRGALSELWSRYLSGARSDIASPLHAEDLSGLGSTYVFTTSSDPVRAEGWRWAMRLVAAGVDVEARFRPGGYHGFEYEQPDAEFSRDAVSEWIAVIRRAVDSSLASVT